MNAAAVDMTVGGLLCAAVRAPLVLSARNTRTLITVFTRWGPLALRPLTSGGQDVVTPGTVTGSGELALQTGNISPTDRLEHEQFYVGSMPARPEQGRAQQVPKLLTRQNDRK